MITPGRTIRARDVAGHYDELDRYYRDLWGEHVHHGLWTRGDESPERAVENLVEHVASRLAARVGARVCDVGCGYGATARRLAENHGLRVTGLTISRAQYAYAVAKTRGRENPRFLLESWESSRLPTASFDGVVSIECLSHVERKDVFFEQVRRVLKPGGRAVIAAWLACDDPSAHQVRRLLEPICREGRLAGLGSQREYRRLIEAAGLRLASFEDLSDRVNKTWNVCVARLLRRLVARREYRSLALRGDPSHAVFLRTVFRIWIAYRTGAMRYGLFVLD